MCAGRVNYSPSRLACRSCLPFRISSSICLVRATLSSSRTSLRLAIRARNWSTDSEPSLLALILAVVIVLAEMRSTGLDQIAIGGKREDSRSTSTNDGSEKTAIQLQSAVWEGSLLLMVTKKVWILVQMWASRAVLIRSLNRLAVVVKALRRRPISNPCLLLYYGHSRARHLYHFKPVHAVAKLCTIFSAFATFYDACH